MNPFLTEKRKWNSYPNKKFKTFKVYEIVLNKRWGKVRYTPSLKLFTFRTLRILWFNCFRLKKKTFVLSNPSWYFVLFCCVFYSYSDFSKQHFTKDNNEKKKPRPQKRNHSLPPSKDMPKISPETRASTFNQPASKRSILGESREVTREQHA